MSEELDKGEEPDAMDDEGAPFPTVPAAAIHSILHLALGSLQSQRWEAVSSHLKKARKLIRKALKRDRKRDKKRHEKDTNTEVHVDVKTEKGLDVDATVGQLAVVETPSPTRVAVSEGSPPPTQTPPREPRTSKSKPKILPPDASGGLLGFRGFVAEKRERGTGKASQAMFGAYEDHESRTVPRALRLWEAAGTCPRFSVDHTETKERKGLQLPDEVTPPLLSTLGKPFEAEVVFCGSASLSCDPFEARGPYFGTYNGDLDIRFRLGRFEVGEEMVGIEGIDYDEDSADDWDTNEGDAVTEESEMSSQGELDGADVEGFIDDDPVDDAENAVIERMTSALVRTNGIWAVTAGPFPFDSSPLSVLDRSIFSVDTHNWLDLKSTSDEADTFLLAFASKGVRCNWENSFEEAQSSQAPRGLGALSEEDISLVCSTVDANPLARLDDIVALLRLGALTSVSKATIAASIRQLFDRADRRWLIRKNPLSFAEVEELLTKRGAKRNRADAVTTSSEGNNINVVVVPTT